MIALVTLTPTGPFQLKCFMTFLTAARTDSSERSSSSAVTPGRMNSAFAVSTGAAFSECMRSSMPKINSPSG